MPGGFGKLHFEAGATPWSWPSLGSPADFLPPDDLQLVVDAETIATMAIKQNNLFVILINFDGMGQM